MICNYPMTALNLINANLMPLKKSFSTTTSKLCKKLIIQVCFNLCRINKNFWIANRPC